MENGKARDKEGGWRDRVIRRQENQNSECGINN
jgi:hypothetical protein